MSQILLPNWVFKVRQFHGVIQIGHNPVAYGITKSLDYLDIKLATTRLISEISAKFVYQNGGFRGPAIVI